MTLRIVRYRRLDEGDTLAVADVALGDQAHRLVRLLPGPSLPPRDWQLGGRRLLAMMVDEYAVRPAPGERVSACRHCDAPVQWERGRMVDPASLVRHSCGFPPHGRNASMTLTLGPTRTLSFRKSDADDAALLVVNGAVAAPGYVVALGADELADWLYRATQAGAAAALRAQGRPLEADLVTVGSRIVARLGDDPA